MSSYSLALFALLAALLALSFASGLAIELFLRKEQSLLARRSLLALASGALIFALQQG